MREWDQLTWLKTITVTPTLMNDWLAWRIHTKTYVITMQLWNKCFLTYGIAKKKEKSTCNWFDSSDFLITQGLTALVRSRRCASMQRTMVTPFAPWAQVPLGLVSPILETYLWSWLIWTRFSRSQRYWRIHGRRIQKWKQRKWHMKSKYKPGNAL